jgi:hypothetical protein
MRFLFHVFQFSYSIINLLQGNISFLVKHSFHILKNLINKVNKEQYEIKKLLNKGNTYIFLEISEKNKIIFIVILIILINHKKSSNFMDHIIA